MCRPASPPLPERPKEGLPGAPAARGDEVPELGGRGGLPTEALALQRGSALR